MEIYYRRFITLLIILFFSKTLFAATSQRIKSISIQQDVSVFSNNFLADTISLKPSDFFSKEKIDIVTEHIKELYYQECYYLVEVNIELITKADDSLWVDLFIKIKPGPKIPLSNIEFYGNSLFTSDYIRSKFYSTLAPCLNQSMLEADIENLLSEYEKHGYPFASISVNNLIIEDTSNSPSMLVTLIIEEGKKIKIDNIQVEGNKETKTNVIVREARFQIGEFYDSRKIKKIPILLNRLKLFSSVNEPELYLLPDTGKENQATGSAGLLLRITEGNPNTFDGIIGYLPQTTSEKGFITGFINVDMRNLFGTGRKLNLKWMRDKRYSQEIGVQYIEPWLFNYPLNVGISFYQRKHDTTFVQRISGLKPEMMLTENFTISGIVNQEYIIAAKTVSADYLDSKRTISIGLEISYDTRNDIYNPTSGLLYTTDYRFGIQKLYSNNKSITLSKIGIDLEYYRHIFKNQVFTASLHSRGLQKTNMQLSDMFRLGGTTTLRGYRENQFLAARVIWLNFEYRLIIGKRSNVFIFFDTGYINNFQYGYGLGSKLETVLGIIGVNIALGKGDSFSQTKLHFGLMNDF